MGEMLTSAIERIREKPEHTRWAMLVVITLVATVLLIGLFVWQVSREMGEVSEEDRGSSGVSAVVSPIQGLKESIGALRRGETPVVPADEAPTSGTEHEAGWWKEMKEVAGYNWELIKDTFK